MSDNDDVMNPNAPASEKRSIWMRGLLMLVFGLFFGIAETLLAMSAIVQFIWMAITRERNQMIVEFGTNMGKWLRQVALFQTGVTEDLPFPWAPWGKD